MSEKKNTRTGNFKRAQQTDSSEDGEQDSRPGHSNFRKVKKYDVSHKDARQNFPKPSGSEREKSPEVNRPNMPKLNLVVCGSDGTIKSSISELILQQTDRRSERVWSEVEIHGRLISLVELPALNQLSEEEVMHQTLRCLSLCHSGVHAFIIIIPVGPLTDGDKAEIEKIQQIFDSTQHFILLFTTDYSVGAPVMDFIKSSPESQRLISLCGNQYSVMGLKELRKSKQIPELLDYIENMKTEPYSLQMHVKAQENRVRQETEEKYKEELKKMEIENDLLKQKIQSKAGVTNSDDDDDDDDYDCNGVRIVLLGKTGVGKSASGNTILSREAFKSKLTSRSVTRECEKETSEFNRRQITVIDTPGLFDTGVDNDETRKEIVKCVSLAAPGPHVFLLVIQLGRFTQEEKDAVKMIQEMFGDQSRMYTMVLFTRGDDLKGTTIKDFIEDDGNLKNLILQCGHRYHVFNNKETVDQTQVSEMLDKIDCMVAANGGSFYTSEMFQQVEKNIREEQERILKEKEEEIKRKEEELRAKYEAEIEQMKKENVRERQEMQNELRKREKEFKKKKEEIKKERDENLRKEMQRKLKKQQKLFEEEMKRKEKSVAEQQQDVIKYLEERHKKEKQKLQEKIQRETRKQAEHEYHEKLDKEVAKALQEAEEKYKIEKEEVLQAAEIKYEMEKTKALEEAEKKYKTEKADILKEAKEKQGAEKAKVLQEAKQIHEAEKAKALQEAAAKHETEKTKILQDAEEKYKTEKTEALQKAEDKHKKKMYKLLQEATDKHKKEMDEAARKHKMEKAKALQNAEHQLPNTARLARDWNKRIPIAGGAVGGLFGAILDI